MTSKQEAVNAYVRAGFALFPCTGDFSNKARGKDPAVKAWQKTPWNPLLCADDLPAVYGVNLPADVVVLDVDPRRYVDGQDELQMLWVQCGLPKCSTLVVQTGSGGFHIYYRLSNDQATESLVSRIDGIPSAAERVSASAIEIKSGNPHRFVIAAGSEHFSGETYEIVRGSIGAIEPIPDALFERIRESNKKQLPKPAARTTGFVDESEANQERYATWLTAGAPESIKGAGGDETAYIVAARGKQFGLTPDTTLALMLEHWNERNTPQWEPEKLAVKVRNAFNYATGESGDYNAKKLLQDIPPAPRGPHPDWEVLEWDTVRVKDYTSEKGYKEVLTPTIRNCVNFFMMPQDYTGTAANPLLDLIRYNSFADEIEFVRLAPWHVGMKPAKRWDDTDTEGLRLYLSKNHLFNCNKELLWGTIINVARMSSYDPLVIWLDSLKWDGKKRLDTWLIDYCGANNNELTAEWGRLPFIGAVRRGYEPGCKFDTMLILEGEEGTGKSAVCEILGGAYYADIKIDPNSKDMPGLMTGRWILEASEMEFLKRTEISAFRSWFTKTTDVVRPAYARVVKDYDRRHVWIGTFNPTASRAYLEDETGDGSGNRRFCPVLTRNINLEGLRLVRDQLWAEAVHRYKAGELSYTTDPKLIAMAKQARQDRMAGDAWEAVIAERLRTWDSEYPLSTAYIGLFALNISIAKISQSDSKRIAVVMRRLGYDIKKTKLNGNDVRVWFKAQNCVV